MVLTLGTSVDELTGEETLNGNEILSSVLELVWVSEDNLGEGCATAGVVHDFLDDTLDVATKCSVGGGVLTLLSRRSQEF